MIGNRMPAHNSPESNAELIRKLEFELSDLAARWRGTDDPLDTEAVVQQYRSTLLRMIELGFHEPLDVDSELPDRLMPPAYFDLFKDM